MPPGAEAWARGGAEGARAPPQAARGGGGSAPPPREHGKTIIFKDFCENRVNRNILSIFFTILMPKQLYFPENEGFWHLKQSNFSKFSRLASLADVWYVYVKKFWGLSPPPPQEKSWLRPCHRGIGPTFIPLYQQLTLVLTNKACGVYSMGEQLSKKIFPYFQKLDGEAVQFHL